jgi:hypothetical protein
VTGTYEYLVDGLDDGELLAMLGPAGSTLDLRLVVKCKQCRPRVLAHVIRAGDGRLVSVAFDLAPRTKAARSAIQRGDPRGPGTIRHYADGPWRTWERADEWVGRPQWFSGADVLLRCDRHGEKVLARGLIESAAREPAGRAPREVHL